MRLPNLRFPHLPGWTGRGKPSFVDNARVPNPKVRQGHASAEQTINLPLWPDDDYRAHPMAPQPQKVSPIAIRALATLSGISPFGPRAVRVTRNGALTVAPELGSIINSQEGTLDAITGAVTALINPPARSIFIANDDTANAITFQVARKANGANTSPDFTTSSTQTIPGGSQPIGIDVTAYGINLPATGNTSAYRIWWIY